MSVPRYPYDDPREWLNRARSNLELAKAAVPHAYPEELCFNAQQAAEKAIKAVFIKLGATFPYTHDIRKLLVLLRNLNVEAPEPVWEAKELTPFAFEFRYPIAAAVTEEQYRWAVGVADTVVRWAEGIVSGPAGGSA